MVRHQKEQIIDRIVDAAITCIRESGTDKVQITQIAAQAGMSTRTLHRYYPEKEALLADAAAKFLGTVYASFATAYSQADKTGLTGLSRLLLLLRLQRELCHENSVDAMLYLDMRSRHPQYDLHKNAWCARGNKSLQQIVIRDLEAGKQDGSIRSDIDTERLAAMIFASATGVIQRSICGSNSELPQEQTRRQHHILDDYIEMLTGYLRP